MIVTRTTLVKGSAFSSHTFSSSSSALTTRPSAESRVCEHPELLLGEPQVAPAPFGHVPGRVEHEVARRQHRRHRGAYAAAERPQTRDQFFERERLGQVVVGPEVEAGDPVLDGARRGQHQYARGALARHQLAADLVAVHERQVAVEDDDVIGIDGGLGQRRFAIEHDVDGETVVPQAPRDRVRQPLFVFDEENAHTLS